MTIRVYASVIDVVSAPGLRVDDVLSMRISRQFLQELACAAEAAVRMRAVTHGREAPVALGNDLVRGRHPPFSRPQPHLGRLSVVSLNGLEPARRA